jgi:uncharacterized protein (TIGR00255 family)
MTGYGRAASVYREKTISIELRAVNAKLTDVKMRLPSDYKDRELELRRIVTEHADRGKIDLAMDVQHADGSVAVALNEGLFRGYHAVLSRLAMELGIHQGDMLQAILRIPNVVGSGANGLEDGEWQAVLGILNEALAQLRQYRIAEGASLRADLVERTRQIQALLQQTGPLEERRYQRMRDRIRTNLEDVLGKDALDQNRFEQEMLFYLEKMDISEEKVRLEQHCLYFLEQMDLSAQQSIGRTLVFISQEMGREINTLGAKAYDADLQRLVVQMKDLLEKIKEQLANVL